MISNANSGCMAGEEGEGRGRLSEKERDVLVLDDDVHYHHEQRVPDIVSHQFSAHRPMLSAGGMHLIFCFFKPSERSFFAEILLRFVRVEPLNREVAFWRTESSTKTII